MKKTKDKKLHFSGRFVAEGDNHKILHGMAKALMMGRYDICIKQERRMVGWVASALYTKAKVCRCMDRN